MRSGIVNLSNNRLVVAGAGGYIWSPRSYSDATDAYYLGFGAADVGPSYSNARWFGFSLRCLAD